MERELSKKERLLAYTNALNNIKNEKYRRFGLCYLIFQANRPKNVSAYGFYHSRLTEYGLFFKNESQAYFPDTKNYWEVREIILLFCIEMTR